MEKFLSTVGKGQEGQLRGFLLASYSKNCRISTQKGDRNQSPERQQPALNCGTGSSVSDCDGGAED